MADIDVICSSCSNKMTVSEHVDIELMKCRKCGGRMSKTGAAAAGPAADPGPKAQLKSTAQDTVPSAAAPAPYTSAAPAHEDPPKKGHLKLRSHESKPSYAPPAPATSVMQEQPAQMSQPEQVVMEGPSRMNMWKAWGLFVVLSAIAYGIRYSGLTPPDILGYCKDAGPFIAGALYVFIIIVAFKDSMFNGILSVLIPFYPFYYLFAVADDFYLRAVAIATLILTGEDSYYFYSQYANSIIDLINEFIRTGGG